ncbi:hypothetical protein FRB99_006017 [Tulasnella sp. 403]|nr:hypothetical protein FRB99_006017 [Tulasnella sp. 403]
MSRMEAEKLDVHQQSQTIDISPTLKQNLRKFRFARRQGTAVFIGGPIPKVNKQKLLLEEVEQLEDISIEELAEELPEAAPRFVVLSYVLKHTDGRTSYPLILINWTPSGSETGLMTLHASAFILFQELSDTSRTIEIRDGAEGLTKEVIEAKLH